jgi:sec-independent protein translocase protein TatC
MKRLEGRESDAKPFMEHLDDLRTMLIRCAIALAIATTIAFPLVPHIFDWLKAPLDRVISKPDLMLQSIEITGAFLIIMRVALWSGLLISAPLLLYFIGQFVFPGLTEKERSLVLRSSGFSIMLFAAGVWLGYKTTLPVALEMMFGMHDWIGIETAPQAVSYVSFAVHLLLAFGLAFQMPVVLVVMGMMGLVSSAQLREKQRYVIVILLVVAMLLTPPDPITQLLMAVPLIILYEACIWLVRFTEKKAAEEQDGATP